ncbi:MAG TPA: hypothetical protein VKA46_11720 [Gemmataceae bacterium]|nr:hypothetical protein [Gemmataceae bacterium]
MSCLCGPSPRDSAGAPAAVKKDSTVTLKITDKARGFTLEAMKPVATDTNAFDVLRHTVAVTYKTDAGGGLVVTGLCGVTPAKGHAWVASLDGKRWMALGSATITKDAVMEWTTAKGEER